MISAQLAIITILGLTNTMAFADSDLATTNFSFASYLGTGYYSSSGQDVFVFQLPLEHIIKEKTNTDAGLLLKLPITTGIINFDSINTQSLPNINDVTTLTFLPGLEYQYPITSNWSITPFIDYGLAHDFNDSTNIIVMGIGVKNHYNIPIKSNLLILGNRFLYAREKNNTSKINSDYSLLETGINYRISHNMVNKQHAVFSNFYYINFYYPNKLVFLELSDNPIRVGIEHEIGVTISNLPRFWLFESPEIGFGVRMGNGVKVFRLVVGAPF